MVPYASHMGPIQTNNNTASRPLSSIPSNAARTAAVMIFIDIVWLSLGVVWLLKFYIQTDLGEAKEIMLGKSIAMLSV